MQAPAHHRNHKANYPDEESHRCRSVDRKLVQIGNAQIADRADFVGGGNVLQREGGILHFHNDLVGRLQILNSLAEKVWTHGDFVWSILVVEVDRIERRIKEPDSKHFSHPVATQQLKR